MINGKKSPPPEPILPHESAVRHVTGEAVYVNDIQMAGMLHGRVVYSSLPHAVLSKLDVGRARALEGVCAVLTAADIPGANQMGPVIHDEPSLAEGEVTFIGQAVALIAAETPEIAFEAEKLVRMELEPLEAITSLEAAMEHGSLLCDERRLECGNADRAMGQAPHTIKGVLRTGAQEHWYLETQTALAVLGEGDAITVYASSQNPSETQAIVAEVLGIPRNQVEVEVARMGGGFGGKETQGNHVAAWAALLANASGRPVKIHLFRDDDQLITGKRHPFLAVYEAGFDNEGRLLAFKVELNADAGAATDLSRAILDRAMFHTDNAYYIPNMKVVGKLWKTNLPSNTAFRGFGGPQGMAVIENVVDRIARELHIDAALVRQRNFYGIDHNNTTHYGQVVENNRLHKAFSELMASSDYEARRKEINTFNRGNEFYKKGLAITPVKFGISFTTAFLNQAGALVNIYADGSVQVNHGGTEMGQGLHTKILGIAAAELGISPADIRINATNTSKVPNTSPTAASSGADMNGMAVKNALFTLKGRLSSVAAAELSKRYPGPAIKNDDIVFDQGNVFPKASPDRFMTFAELANAARLHQVSLSATGYYKVPGIWFDQQTRKGEPFYYYAFGMAVSEVMVDLLTGCHTLLRTDILHDVGDSLNPAIDTGQVEGGFVQGLGWCTTEEMKWDSAGRQLTHSPDTYKIPRVRDIPQVFNVKLMDDLPNPGTIRGSKAVGEPPFMLALSAWLAIKDALSAAGDHLAEPDFSLPATAEVVLLSLEGIRQKAEGKSELQS